MYIEAVVAVGILLMLLGAISVYDVQRNRPIKTRNQRLYTVYAIQMHDYRHNLWTALAALFVGVGMILGGIGYAWTQGLL